MVTSTEDECDVSSVPQGIRPSAANNSQAETNTTESTTISEDDEKKAFVLSIDQGEMTAEEKALELSQDMQETCQGKSVRKTKEVGMSEGDYDLLKSGGVVALPNIGGSRRSRRDSDGCNKVVGVLNLLQSK